MKRLKNKKPEDWKLHFINYDNMCNVARLRLLQGRLALPEPFPTIFLDVDKVIDDLHIKSQLDKVAHWAPLIEFTGLLHLWGSCQYT